MLSNVKKENGFTLVEMLVTMSIFVTAITTLSAIFLLTNQSQRKNKALQDIQTDARFSMEVVSQQIRRGVIDYDFYDGSIDSNPQTILALLDSAGNKIQFRRFEASGRGELQISQDNGMNWTALTPPDISILDLFFYISPTTDPFAQTPLNNLQPLVTIALISKNITTSGESIPNNFLQTTVSSRQYLR